MPLPSGEGIGNENHLRLLDSRLRGNDGCREAKRCDKDGPYDVLAQRPSSHAVIPAWDCCTNPGLPTPSFPRRRESRSPGRFLFPVPSPEGKGRIFRPAPP